MAASERSTRDRFHVGQRVIWTTPNRNEFICTLLAPRRPIRHAESQIIVEVYRVDVDGFGTSAPDGNVYAAPENELRPLYDGDQVTSWETCAWRPQMEGVRRGC